MNPETVDLRQRVFDLLGGACVTCGESNYDKLQIDHVDHDGAEDRRLHQERGKAKYARFLRRYPIHGTDRKCLKCFNCNLADEQRRAIDLGDQRVPVAKQKLQIRVNVLKVTFDFLTERESSKRTKGDIIDEVVEFYLSVGKSMDELKSMLSGVQGQPVSPSEPAQPVPPVPTVSIAPPWMDPHQWEAWKAFQATWTPEGSTSDVPEEVPVARSWLSKLWRRA
jgi:hypothetical protein